jgi:hypothetical protein
MHRTFPLLTGLALLGAAAGCHSDGGDHCWHGVCDCNIPVVGYYGGPGGHGGPAGGLPPGGPPPLAGAPAPLVPVPAAGGTGVPAEPIRKMPQETPKAPEKVDQPPTPDK